MYHVSATHAHTAHYADPIAVEAGASITLTVREDVWDGHRWLWAIAQDGREGWIPDSLVDTDDAHPIARFAYSALELSCSVGERLIALRETHGWVWCRNAEGAQGWVPQRGLKLM